jgi:methionine salvage enolase-phosphatase E1
VSTEPGLRAILTDIEGTTSSIAFVKDVLFPYSRERLPAFVEAHGDEPEVQHWLRDRIGLRSSRPCCAGLQRTARPRR